MTESEIACAIPLMASCIRPFRRSRFLVHYDWDRKGRTLPRRQAWTAFRLDRKSKKNINARRDSNPRPSPSAKGRSIQDGTFGQGGMTPAPNSGASRCCRYPRAGGCRHDRRGTRPFIRRAGAHAARCADYRCQRFSRQRRVAAQRKSAHETCSRKKQTILVVDADSSHRQSMRRALRAESYRVLEAVDYRYAENVQQQHCGQIDLLVTAIAAGRQRLRVGQGIGRCGTRPLRCSSSRAGTTPTSPAHSRALRPPSPPT
jgi:CheY-like chemotaxis protein